MRSGCLSAGTPTRQAAGFPCFPEDAIRCPLAEMSRELRDSRADRCQSAGGGFGTGRDARTREPIAGARIWVYDQTSRNARTDAEGMFHVDGLREGQLQLQFVEFPVKGGRRF